MQPLELIIVLGAHVGRNEQGQWDLAPHTKMRARAAGIAMQKGLTIRLLMSGGFNVGVRYGEYLSHGVYGPSNPDLNRKKPDFSPEAKARAHSYPSEAALMAGFVIREYGVSADLIDLEEDSSTTEQNAEYCFAKAGAVKQVGVLTLFYHHEDGAIQLFAQQFAKVGIVPVPVYAEDLLVLANPTEWIPKIMEYYSTPKGKGRLRYDVSAMRKLMETEQSISSTPVVQT